jgi:hypothetical protein
MKEGGRERSLAHENQ